MSTSNADLYYNQVRAKASHNSYQRKEGLSDQLVYWRIRSLELDLHNSNNGAGWPALPNDWYVYHVSVSDDDSSVRTFSDALRVLAGFHAAVPDHEVCTIALDIKDSFDATHTPQQLDALINAALPGCVYTPADFLGPVNTNLQQSAGKWPKLSALRGKFVFILTTGNIDDAGSHLNQYVDNGATANIRTGFVAPEITSTAQITAKNYAVWFNMKIANSPSLGPSVFNAGFMSRGYGGNSSGDWNKGITGKNHLVGTDDVNSLVDTWARTDNSHGWPFQGISVSADPNLAEPGTVIGINVSSDDIWGKNDSCAFAAFPTSGNNSYSYAVSVPGSHVPDNWGKAGLMARSSSASDAANFCIVRAAADNVMRVQSRAKSGDSTNSWDLAVPASVGVVGDTWMYLRLTLSNGAKTAQAWGSADGANWTSIHRQDFDQALNLQGIVGSSHDDDESIRYLYLPLAGSTVASTTVTRIGDDVSATAFLGVYPPT